MFEYFQTNAIAEILSAFFLSAENNG